MLVFLVFLRRIRTSSIRMCTLYQGDEGMMQTLRIGMLIRVSMFRISMRRMLLSISILSISLSGVHCIYDARTGRQCSQLTRWHLLTLEADAGRCQMCTKCFTVPSLEATCVSDSALEHGVGGEGGAGGRGAHQNSSKYISESAPLLLAIAAVSCGVGMVLGTIVSAAKERCGARRFGTSARLAPISYHLQDTYDDGESQEMDPAGRIL